jgi:hypothetical protein
MKRLDIAVLLSFTAGFVDTASFLGLEGLFTAGNFVTLGATLVYGTHGVLAIRPRGRLGSVSWSGAGFASNAGAAAAPR